MALSDRKTLLKSQMCFSVAKRLDAVPHTALLFCPMSEPEGSGGGKQEPEVVFEIVLILSCQRNLTCISRSVKLAAMVLQVVQVCHPPKLYQKPLVPIDPRF